MKMIMKMINAGDGTSCLLYYDLSKKSLSLSLSFRFTMSAFKLGSKSSKRKERIHSAQELKDNTSTKSNKARAKRHQNVGTMMLFIIQRNTVHADALLGVLVQLPAIFTTVSHFPERKKKRHQKIANNNKNKNKNVRCYLQAIFFFDEALVLCCRRRRRCRRRH
jgi:hypothetical protein